jgi:hypothetical protein
MCLHAGEHDREELGEIAVPACVIQKHEHFARQRLPELVIGCIVRKNMMQISVCLVNVKVGQPEQV